MSAFDSGMLCSSYKDARLLMTLQSECSYWISSRDRIMNQFVYKDKNNTNSNNYGVILPQTITMGTVTRRATEPTWLTVFF